VSLDLATLLFGTYRRDILALLLLHPETSLHLREIARQTAKPPGTLMRELNRLVDAGILLRKPLGNLVLYQSNGRCPIFEELRNILKKTSGIGDVVREMLEPLGARIRVAFVYGSVARGDEREGSDLDLMVVGDVSIAEVVGALGPASQVLRREVNPNLYSPKEFAAALAGGEPFLRRLMSDRKIFVIGAERDLGELAAHRQAQAASRVLGRDRKAAGVGKAGAGGRKRRRA